MPIRVQPDAFAIHHDPFGKNIWGRILQVKNENISEAEADHDEMRQRLEEMYDRGVGLFVDGRAVLPYDKAIGAVCEDSSYMADYVFGEEGQLAQVRFDKVTER